MSQVILIKVSGNQLNKTSSSILSYIKELIGKNMKIILVFGGGKQIDKYRKSYSGKERQKIDGIGVTDKEIIKHGVMPAYKELIDILENYFSNTIYHIVSPENINCTYKEGFGEVGTLETVDNIDLSKSLNILGFVGVCGGNHVNINADEIASSIIKRHKELMKQVIFVSNTPGVLDKKGNILPTISSSMIPQLLGNYNDNVLIKDGMVKKLEEISILLQFVNKVVLLDNIYNLNETNKGTTFYK